MLERYYVSLSDCVFMLLCSYVLAIDERRSLVRRISILNFKGGTGKTSVAENLGHALARQGKTVFVIDGDRQSNTTTTLLGKRVNPSLSDDIRGNVQLTE